MRLRSSLVSSLSRHSGTLMRRRCGALTRLRNAEDTAQAVEVDGEINDARSARIRGAVLEAGRAEPIPILATLIRTGVVYPAALVGGGVAAYGLTEFGRRLLTDLENLEAWP